MTLKQDELIRRLPKNGYNISKTAREVGYTDSSSKSGLLYEAIRKRLAKAYSPEQVKADICKAEKDFAKAKDNSNRARMLELRAKIIGLCREKPSVGVAILQAINDLPPLPVEDKPIIEAQTGQEPSIDVTSSNSKG